MKILTKTKVTFLCHNVIEHESSWLKKFLTKLVLAGGDKLVTQSQSETDKIKSLLKNNSVETAFHPTYADLKTGKEITKSEAQKQLNIDDNAILFFGFVRQYKGLDILLDAMPKILDRNSTLILLVVGEFWKNKADYLEQIERLKLSENIRLFDEYIPNEELSLYFTAADLVVQPYRSVTGSGVCQLSYGLDTPVIATDLGSLKDVITDKENGRLVPPENPDALADAIIESLEAGNLAKMTKAAVDTKKRYSWERFVQILTGQNE